MLPSDFDGPTSDTIMSMHENSAKETINRARLTRLPNQCSRRKHGRTWADAPTVRPQDRVMLTLQAAVAPMARSTVAVAPMARSTVATWSARVDGRKPSAYAGDDVLDLNHAVA
jgi:hypothetical protein